VSKTMGSIVGTEAEAEVTTVEVGATVAKESTVAVATEVVGVALVASPMRVSNR